jgi:23S rRNA A2030 N6-methylase RlmJ
MEYWDRDAYERTRNYYKDSHRYIVFIDHHFNNKEDYSKMRVIREWLDKRWWTNHFSKCLPVHNPHHEDYPDVIHSIDDIHFNYGLMCVWFRNSKDAIEFKLTWG